MLNAALPLIYLILLILWLGFHIISCSDSAVQIFIHNCQWYRDHMKLQTEKKTEFSKMPIHIFQHNERTFVFSKIQFFFINNYTRQVCMGLRSHRTSIVFTRSPLTNTSSVHVGTWNTLTKSSESKCVRKIKEKRKSKTHLKTFQMQQMSNVIVSGSKNGNMALAKTQMLSLQYVESRNQWVMSAWICTFFTLSTGGLLDNHRLQNVTNLEWLKRTWISSVLLL